MTKKVYLVDTENVNIIWKELLSELTKNDRMLLFYTPNSPHISYPDLRYILSYPESFEMIECYTGNNGLDFQLVSYLGFLLKTAAKTEYIIVSNDTGYDPVIRFWTDRERSVSRMTSKQLVKKKQSHPPQEKDRPAPLEDEPAPSPQEPRPGKQKKQPASKQGEGQAEPSAPPPQKKGRRKSPARQPEPKEPEAQQPPTVPEVPPQSEEPPMAAAQPEEGIRPDEEPVKAQEAAAPASAEEALPAPSQSLTTEEPPALPPEPVPALPAPAGGEEPPSPEGLIQNALGKDCPQADGEWMLEMLAQYNANQFSKIHIELQRKFGADQGLVYYKRLRTVLRKFYSLKSAAEGKT